MGRTLRATTTTSRVLLPTGVQAIGVKFRKSLMMRYWALAALAGLISIELVCTGNTNRWSWGWEYNQERDPTVDIDISDNELYGTNSDGDPDKPENSGWHMSDFFNSRFIQMPDFPNIHFLNLRWPRLHIPEYIQIPDFPVIRFPSFSDFPFPGLSSDHGAMCACPEDNNGQITGSSEGASWSFSWSWYSVSENGTESTSQNSTCRISCSSVCQCDLLNSTLEDDQQDLTEECKNYCNTSEENDRSDRYESNVNDDAVTSTDNEDKSLQNEPIVQMQPV